MCRVASADFPRTICHQFESIHPFYDGNGCTGRILNLPMLQREGLMELPVLYLSRYIASTKAQYYQLLQATRETHGWAGWCVYVVKGVAITARSAVRLIKQLREVTQATKLRLRNELPKLASGTGLPHPATSSRSQIRRKADISPLSV
ncbi:MAG: Fic family protein [Pseudomonadota bacterium]